MNSVLIRLLIAISVLNATTSPANAGEGGAIGLTVGALIGASTLGYYGFTLDELQGWKDPKSQSTIELGSECGLLYEARLYGNNSDNFFVLILKNTNSGEIEWKYDEIEFNFSSQRSRLPAMMSDFSPLVLHAGDVRGGMFLFPSKEDFEKASSLTVRVPIKTKSGQTCYLEPHFSHDSTASDPHDSTSRSSFEFQFGGGANLSRSGHQQEFATLGANAEIGFSGYSGLHWGTSLLVFIDTMGTSDSTKLASLTKDANMNPKLTTSYFGWTASYRNSLSKKWSWSYDLGPALGLESFDRANQSNRELGTTFAIIQRLQLNFLLSKHQLGLNRGELSIGVGLTDVYTPNFSGVEGVSFGGNLLGVSLHLITGL